MPPEVYKRRAELYYSIHFSLTFVSKNYRDIGRKATAFFMAKLAAKSLAHAHFNDMKARENPHGVYSSTVAKNGRDSASK